MATEDTNVEITCITLQTRKSCILLPALGLFTAVENINKDFFLAMMTIFYGNYLILPLYFEFFD